MRSARKIRFRMILISWCLLTLASPTLARPSPHPGAVEATSPQASEAAEPQAVEEASEDAEAEDAEAQDAPADAPAPTEEAAEENTEESAKETADENAEEQPAEEGSDESVAEDVSKVEELSDVDVDTTREGEKEYEVPKSDDPLVNRGRELLGENSKLLTDLEYEYLVEREVIMGIWGIETRYGENFGSQSVAQALLEYRRKRPDRAKFVQEQIAAMARLADRGILDPGTTRSSYAGALGHTQFIPTSIEHFAVDGDGDGKIDLWNVQDALASTANYLNKHGWKFGQPWGFQVELPKGFYDRSGTRKRQEVDFWVKQGVKPVYEDNKMPSAGFARVERYKGKDYLLFDNFFVIMKYNISRDYAYAVSALGDMVVHAARQGVAEVQQDISAPSSGGETITSLDTPSGAPAAGSAPAPAPSCGSEICRIQKALKKRGLYGGAIDGQPGPQLSRAIAQWQLQNGMPVDGKITKMLSSRLK